MLAEWAAEGVRGEVTLVVQGAVQHPVDYDADTLRRLVEADQESAGRSRRDAIASVAKQTGVPRRAVYDAVHRD